MPEGMKPIPFEKAMDKAEEICRKNKIKVSKEWLKRLLREKTEDGKALRWFWSVPIPTGGRIGCMIVDKDGTFESLLLTALSKKPYVRKAGNIPVVHEENLRPPGG